MEEPCRHDPFSPADCHGEQPRLLLPRDVRHGLLGYRWEAAMSRPWMLPFAFAFALLSCGGAAVADAQPLPAASGRVIEAADGDVVVVPRDARVTVVTRGQVQARLVYVAAQQTLLLLPGLPRRKWCGSGVRVRALGGIAASAPAAGPAPPAGAVRVGGSIRAPIRSLAVNPIYPPEAQRARIQGVVILEIHIGADGAVANARILRSIPALDQAALDAVRQWRYEPTLLNGVPVPVIMTATVNFALQPAAR